MADALVSRSDDDCSDKNFSDRDSSDERVDSNPATDFSTEKRKSSQDPKASSLKHSTRTRSLQNAEWKTRFPYLPFRHFLLHTRSINDKQTGVDLSPPKKKKREELEGIYADDKGYFQGEIYEELGSDEELGFMGDVCKKLNLMPSDSLADHEIHSKDTESLRTDLQTDDHTPEIIVVPSARFVREITNGK
ncbi:uncharacterized protein LOC144653060 [Oculina patagonica]